MANNYLEYSAFLEIPPAKIGQARSIVAREIAKLEENDEWGYCGTGADVESRGVWFHAGGIRQHRPCGGHRPRPSGGAGDQRAVLLFVGVHLQQSPDRRVRRRGDGGAAGA